MAGAVQFYGKQQVLDASENMASYAWAIYHSGSKLFTKYEGSDESESKQMLDQALEMLERNNSEAIYLVKFFEVEEGRSIKINEKTVCDGGSFQFKMTTPEAREQRQIGYLGQLENYKQEQRILALEKQLKESKEEDPVTLEATLVDLIKRPEELGYLVNIGRVLMGFEPRQMGAIGRIRTSEEVTNEEATVLPKNREEEVERLSVAIDDLEKGDSKLVERLEKMAKLKKEKPEEYKRMISLFDMMQ